MNEPNEQRMESRISRVEKVIHGDYEADPPRPGIQQVLQEMYKSMTDKERGNEALHARTKEIELRDMKRVAWMSGATWIIAGLTTGIGFLVGILVQLHQAGVEK